MHMVECVGADQIALFCAFPGSYPLTAAHPSMRQADAHWMAVDQSGAIRARCSLWWHEVPDYPAERLGFIGHYAADDEATSPYAAALLRHACHELAWQGCTLAVGPLDGNTFRHYRLLTERSLGDDLAPSFFLEPDNPDAWPLQFAAVGFHSLARYFSAAGPLSEDDPRLASLQSGIDASGITVRAVDLDDFDAELRRVFSVVLGGFQANFLYMPISETEFLAQYRSIRPALQPELLLIAEQDRDPVGFIFAVPDLAQAQRGETVDTVILKTVAVLPDIGGHGLGGLLVARCQQAARQLGMKRAIHALMFEDNISRKISRHYARPMRRYTLFQREL